jgi:tetratricopeptide (TPR) repeat protein
MRRRAVVLIAALGLLAAAGLYGASRPAWRTALAGWFASSEQGTTNLTGAEWPICSTMPAMASDDDWAQLEPDFAAGKKALAAADWAGAIAALELAALRDPYNADLQNYIGYAHRRLRQLGPAMQHYQQALVLNRRHRSAHEHLGELYLVLGDLSQAEQHLAALEDICLIPCVETEDLKRAISVYRAVVVR